MELITNKEKELEFMLKNSKSLFKLFVKTSPGDLKKRVKKTYSNIYLLFEAMVKQDILEGIETKEETEYIELLEKEGLIKKKSMKNI